jgi:hypothetical protein
MVMLSLTVFPGSSFRRRLLASAQREAQHAMLTGGPHGEALPELFAEG